MKIGVFDSGIGGKSVANSISQAFPRAEVQYVADTEHMPYGQRERKDIIRLTDAAIQPLLAGGCDVIVLACNTATAAAISELRLKYPHQPFIGLEPMVKTATKATKTGKIVVCATPFTLGSERYLALKAAYAQGVEVTEPDCSQWAGMIEHDKMNHEVIAAAVNGPLERGADVVVLACTHYHWIKQDVERIAAGRAVVIDPSEAIVRRIRQLLRAYQGLNCS